MARGPSRLSTSRTDGPRGTQAGRRATRVCGDDPAFTRGAPSVTRPIRPSGRPVSCCPILTAEAGTPAIAADGSQVLVLYYGRPPAEATTCSPSRAVGPTWARASSVHWPRRLGFSDVFALNARARSTQPALRVRHRLASAVGLDFGWRGRIRIFKSPDPEARDDDREPPGTEVILGQPAAAPAGVSAYATASSTLIA